MVSVQENRNGFSTVEHPCRLCEFCENCPYPDEEACDLWKNWFSDRWREIRRMFGVQSTGDSMTDE